MRGIRLFIYCILTLSILGCKGKMDRKLIYADKPDLFPCGVAEMDLIKDAVYAFEAYATQHYCFTEPKTAQQAYYFYWVIAKTNRLPALEYVDSTIIGLRDQLKGIDGLWLKTDASHTLNYNHPIIACIANNMEDDSVRKTFNQLLDFNTFNTQVFLASLKRHDDRIKNDRAFETFLILDTFYARILDVDFSDIDTWMKQNLDNDIKRREAFKDSLNPEQLIKSKLTQ